MPVRSINLKLIIPRGVDRLALRQSLWTTHAEVNAATRYYEEQLLVFRATPYERSAEGGQSPPVMLEANEMLRMALSAARKQQKENLTRAGKEEHPPGSDDEVLAAIRALYHRLLPEETGEGSAQDANAYLSPLTDPNSKGFAGAAEKLSRPRPNWLSMPPEDPEAADAAAQWYDSDASAEWRTDTGSPAKWLRAARAQKSEWPRLFREYLQDLQQKRSSGKEADIARLRELRLLPLFEPYFPQRMAHRPEGVTPWDRLAFRLAVSHMLSWEAWCRRAALDRANRIRRRDEYKATVITPDMEPLIGRIRVFEKTRSEKLGQLGLGPAEYDLRPRQLRGWPDLREAWRKAKAKGADTLQKIAADHQAKKRGKFGDPEVFRWLAEPQQHDLWAGAFDVATVAATLNAIDALVTRSRETATMTLPDARRHPRAIQWAAVGDSNLRHYRLRVNDDDTMGASLRLLACDEAGKLVEREEEFVLAPSGQMRNCKLGMRQKKASIEFTTDGGQTFTGTLGSADLLMDREFLARTREEEIEAGSIGPAWLKVVIDVDPIVPEGWDKTHASFRFHFQTAWGTKSKKEEALRDGARVLSVDLGIRAFAACSVFVLRDRAPGTGKLSFETQLSSDAVKYAVHERSFHLLLPGEEPDREGRIWRKEREDDIRGIRACFGRYRRLMRLTGAERDEREAELQDARTALSESEPFTFETGIVDALSCSIGAAKPIWDKAVVDALGRYRTELGPVIKKWRRTGREKQNFARVGKSMWAIQHLTDVRRVLMSWSLLGRQSGEIRRLDRDGRGTFASNLLAHIDNMKEDRLKTGADLIVRAAMGFVRDKGGKWEEKHEPCDVILFEDLSRYRMRTDRPRRENSQLMRWAHRGVPGEVKMQSMLHTIEVEDTSAAFSSRYYARNGTPGIRCRALTSDDLSNTWLQADLEQDGIDLTSCRAGDLVPRDGGDVFVCLDREDRLVRIDADINAAQNLQRRFWTRHATAFRLPCFISERDSKTAWIPKPMGKRLAGALGGAGLLIPTGHETGSCRWQPETNRKERLTAISQGDAEFGDDDEEDIAALTAEAEVESGQVEVFFRDPSGAVLPEGFWCPSRTFWGIVRGKTLSALKRQLAETTRR